MVQDPPTPTPFTDFINFSTCAHYLNMYSSVMSLSVSIEYSNMHYLLEYSSSKVVPCWKLSGKLSDIHMNPRPNNLNLWVKACPGLLLKPHYATSQSKQKKTQQGGPHMTGVALKVSLAIIKCHIREKKLGPCQIIQVVKQQRYLVITS